MSEQCLSACGPCDHFAITKTVCPLCAKSYDDTWQAQEDKVVRDAIRALTSRGYIVTPPDDMNKN